MTIWDFPEWCPEETEKENFDEFFAKCMNPPEEEQT